MAGDGGQALGLIQFLLFFPLQFHVDQFPLMGMLILLLFHELVKLFSKFLLF
jgi:hypothetical protein